MVARFVSHIGSGGKLRDVEPDVCSFLHRLTCRIEIETVSVLVAGVVEDSAVIVQEPSRGMASSPEIRSRVDGKGKLWVDVQVDWVPLDRFRRLRRLIRTISKGCLQWDN